jgi:hypothetical protein
VGKPGDFTPVTEAESYLSEIENLVKVQHLRLAGAGPQPAVVIGDSSLESTNSPPMEDFQEEFEDADTPQTVVFYPDGTSDSVEIILASRDGEDTRRMSVKLTGSLGSVRRSYMPDPSEEYQTNQTVSAKEEE